MSGEYYCRTFESNDYFFMSCSKRFSRCCRLRDLCTINKMCFFTISSGFLMISLISFSLVYISNSFNCEVRSVAFDASEIN